MGGNLRGPEDVNRKVEAIRRAFIQNINTLENFQTKTVQIRNPMNQLTDDIANQNTTLKQSVQAWKQRNQLAEHQMKLRRTQLALWSKDASGNLQGDAIMQQRIDLDNEIPKWEKWRTVMATNGAALGELSRGIVNFGKNMQWAGRQLTVGITVPLSILTHFASQAALEVDKQLTRIVKVYNFAGGQTAASMNQVKEASQETARAIAADIGIMESATLDVTATFAQMGRTGEELQGMTEMTMRIATLGEIEHQTAVNLTRTTMDAFGLSIEETGATLNRFNAIENATVLNLNEMANELPQISGTLSTFGESAEFGAAMLAALKERGSEVNEAATALRFGLQRLADPVPEAREQFAALGLDISKALASGGLEATLYQIADVVGGITDEAKRIEVVGELVGRRQADRWIRLLDAMSATNRETGAFAEAMEAAGLSSVEAAAMAEGELQNIRESAAGTFQILKAQLGVAFADLGKTLLPLLLQAMRVALNLLEGFNALPGAVKTFVIALATIVGVSGPLIMIAGLIPNLVGNFGSFIAMVQRTIARIGFFSEAETIAKIATRDLTSATEGAISAFSRMDLEARKAATGLISYAEAMAMARGSSAGGAAGAAAAQAQMSPLLVASQGRISAQMVQTQPAQAGVPIRYARPNPNMDPKSGYQGNVVGGEIDELEAKYGKAGNAAKKFGSQHAMVMGTALAAVGSMVTEVGSLGNTILSLATPLLLIDSLIGGKIIGSISRMVMTVGKAVVSALHLGGVVGKLGVAAKGVWGALTAFGGAPLAAIAAVGFAFVTLKRHVDGARESFVSIEESAKGAADSIGASWLEVGDTINEQGEIVEGYASKFETFKEQNAEFVEQLRGMGEENLMSRIRLMGAEMVAHGVGVEEAQEAMRMALQASGNTQIRVDTLLDIDLESVEDQMEEVNRLINTSLAENPMSIGEKIWSFLGGSALGAQAINDAKSIGQRLGRIVATGTVEEIEAQFENANLNMEGQIANIEQQIAGGDRSGIQRLEELYEARRLINEATIDSLNLSREEFSANQTHNQLLEQIATTTKGNRLAAERDIRNAMAQSVATLRFLNEEEERAMKIRIYEQHGLTDLADELRNYGKVAAETTEEIEELTDAQKEMMQFAQNLRSEIGERASEMSSLALSDFDDVTDNIMEGYDDQADAADRSFDRQEKASDESFRKREKAAEDYWDNRIEAAEDAADKEIDATEKLYDTRIKRAKEANEAEQESTEDAYDARIKAIEDAIEAEEEADDRRQKIHDRERDRLEYLAAQANRTISIDFALITGDLEQAAILQSEAQAASQDYENDLAEQAAREGLEARQQARKDDIERLEEEKRARIEAIKEEGEAIKEQLQEEKELRLDTLKAAKEATQERLRDAKEIAKEELRVAKQLASERIKAARDASRRDIENRREAERDKRAILRDSLDRELEALMQQTPKTRAEYDALVKKVEKIMDDHGVEMNTKAMAWEQIITKGWTGGVIDARKSIAEDKAWEAFGKKIADATTRGIMGLTTEQLFNYLETGKFPTNVAASRRISTYSTGGGIPEKHTGGPIDGNKRWPGLKSDERPIIAQVGEYMIDRNTVKAMGGPEFFRALQSNPEKAIMSKEGRMHSGGMVNAAALDIQDKAVSLAQMALTKMGESIAGPVGGEFERGGKWPPRSWGRASANTLAALRFGRERWPSRYGFGMGLDRGVASSDHSWGKAIDFMVTQLGTYPDPRERALGWQIANWFVNNPKEFGTKYVIWDKKINQGRGWRPYTRYGSNPGPTLGHYDHPHVSFLHSGGPVKASLPQLRNGGKINYDNTIANLHRGERVLTERNTEQLDRGLQRLEQAGDHYEINVVAGPGMDTRALAREVVKQIDAKKRRVGTGIKG